MDENTNNSNLFVAEDGVVSDEYSDLVGSDLQSLGYHVIPNEPVFVGKQNNSESSEIDKTPEVVEKTTEESPIQSPVLKRKKRRKKRKKKDAGEGKKEEENEKKVVEKKRSVVDEILSKQYWKKKKRIQKKKRKARIKKLSEEKKVVVVKSLPKNKQHSGVTDVSPIPDQYDRKEILDGEVKGWNVDEDSLENLNQKIQEVLKEDDEKKENEGDDTNEKIEQPIDGGKENDGESEMKKESKEVIDDQIWDVSDGLYDEGKEFFNVEVRTKELLKDIDENTIIKELEQKQPEEEGAGSEKMEGFVNEEELGNLENELNRIFGIKEEEPIVPPKPKKKRKRKMKKKQYKSVLDEILSPGYWSRTKSPKKGEKRKKVTKKRKKKKEGNN